MLESDNLFSWGGSLHQTLRLLPAENQSPSLPVFLEAGGLSPAEILVQLPYDKARAIARGASGEQPDAKRYRDPKQVYQTIGLIYEAADALVITELGAATYRWLKIINQKNRLIFAKHVAYALAACQLRNPTGAGSKVEPGVEVFPFLFIWKAMIELEGKLHSDELNRCLLRVRNLHDLDEAILRIRMARSTNTVSDLGPEILTKRAKNDRIIPWMSLASFGWVLFPDKRSGGNSGFYELPNDTLPIIKEASRVTPRHKEFANVKDYVEYLSNCAGLPQDMR